MNDLLANIPGDGRCTEQNNEYRMDIEAGGPHATSSTDADMADFFREVAEIKDAMSEIRKKLQKLQEAHEESKTVTKAEGMKALKQRMESDVDEVSKKARTIKSKLEALDKANMVNRKKPGCGEGSSADRARMSMTVSLKRKLKDLMSEFQMLRQRFHDEYREVVERRIFTVTGKRADEETIEQLIETGDSESIFQKAIKEQGRGQILETVAEIQERHDAVRELEKKLLDLHQIFLDMAVLVEEQGEMLDNIENQVSKAVDHVQAGTDALHKAKKSQRSKRKWMCFAIVLLLVIIVIIVVTVIKPWKSKSA